MGPALECVARFSICLPGSGRSVCLLEREREKNYRHASEACLKEATDQYHSLPGQRTHNFRGSFGRSPKVSRQSFVLEFIDWLKECGCCDWSNRIDLIWIQCGFIEAYWSLTQVNIFKVSGSCFKEEEEEEQREATGSNKASRMNKPARLVSRSTSQPASHWVAIDAISLSLSDWTHWKLLERGVQWHRIQPWQDKAQWRALEQIQSSSLREWNVVLLPFFHENFREFGGGFNSFLWVNGGKENDQTVIVCVRDCCSRFYTTRF